MIVTLTGANRFMLQAELDGLVAAFLAEFDDMGLERLDGEEVEYDRIRESLQSLPFLASKKLVVLRTPGVQKQFVENIEALIEELPEPVDVIIVEPKLDKRSLYFKALKAKTQFKEFTEMDAQGLSRWLVAEAKVGGGSLSQNDALYLVDRIGVNQLMLSSELQKLLNYDKSVTRQTIELLSERTPQSTVFELLDAAFAGQTKKALELYDEQRMLKVEPIAIIALIAWQLHALAVLKAGGDRSLDDIARESKLSPYVLRKSQRIAAQLTLKGLKELVGKVLALDIALKSQSIDPDEAMRNLILELGQ